MTDFIRGEALLEEAEINRIIESAPSYLVAFQERAAQQDVTERHAAHGREHAWQAEQREVHAVEGQQVREQHRRGVAADGRAVGERVPDEREQQRRGQRHLEAGRRVVAEGPRADEDRARRRSRRTDVRLGGGWSCGRDNCCCRGRSLSRRSYRGGINPQKRRQNMPKAPVMCGRGETKLQRPPPK